MFLQSEGKPGDFVLVQPHGLNLIGKLVEEFTEGSFCHVCILATPTTVLEAKPGEAYQENPLGYTRYGVWTPLSLTYAEPTDEQRAEIVAYGRSLIGKMPYNLLQDLGFALEDVEKIFKKKVIKNPFFNSHDGICSSSTHKIYTKVWYPVRPDLDESEIVPQDFIYSDRIKMKVNHNLFRP